MILDSTSRFLTGLGAISLMTAWIPMVLRKMPLSLPIFCVAVGAALFTMPQLRPFAVHPLQYPVLMERPSEFVVVVAHLDIWTILFTALTILVVRPFAGLISLAALELPWREKLVILKS